jgi:integrase
MSLSKRGRAQVWYISTMVNGRQVRISTRTTNKKLAQRIHDKVVGQIAEGKWFEGLSGKHKTFKEMMDRYMSEYSIPKKASSERDLSSLSHLLPFFGNRKIPEITPKLVYEYKNKRRSEEASPCTINRELALMKHAFNLAIREWEWTTTNPVIRVSMEKEPPSRDRWLTWEEEEALLSVSPQWLKEIIVFAVETGCRREEILSLAWKDVDIFKKVVTIFAKKTGDRRTIPLTARAFEIFVSKEKARTKRGSIKREEFVFPHPGRQKVNFHTLRWAFEKALEKAEIEGFRFHDLRHTFASRLAQQGVDPYTIQKLMGHKTFTTTQRYAHHYSESLRSGIKALEDYRAERSEKLAQIQHTWVKTDGT